METDSNFVISSSLSKNVSSMCAPKIFFFTYIYIHKLIN